MNKLFLVLILLISLPSFSARKGKMEIKEVTSKKLIDVFTQMERLSQLMYERNDQLAVTQLETLKVTIQKAIRAAKEESFKGQHMNRLLLSAQESLVSAQNTSGNQKIKNIKVAYKQLVTLYESYKLNLTYKVYWCKIDRSVWLQKGTKILNPFEPKSNCGRPVN